MIGGFEYEYELLVRKAEGLSKPMKKKKFVKKFEKFVKHCIKLAPFITAVAALLMAIARLRSSGKRKIRLRKGILRSKPFKISRRRNR